MLPLDCTSPAWPAGMLICLCRVLKKASQTKKIVRVILRAELPKGASRTRWSVFFSFLCTPCLFFIFFSFFFSSYFFHVCLSDCWVLSGNSRVSTWHRGIIRVGLMENIGYLEFHPFPLLPYAFEFVRLAVFVACCCYCICIHAYMVFSWTY